jgi:ribosomal protein L35AE/L33A
MALEVGDKVKWKWPEPGADETELEGRVTKVYVNTGDVSVKFNDGNEDICDESDLVKI